MQAPLVAILCNLYREAGPDPPEAVLDALQVSTPASAADLLGRSAQSGVLGDIHVDRHAVGGGRVVGFIG